MKKTKPKENNKTIEQLAKKLAGIFIAEIQLQKRSENTHNKQNFKPNEKITKQIKPKTEINY